MYARLNLPLQLTSRGTGRSTSLSACRADSRFNRRFRDIAVNTSMKAPVIAL